MFKFYPFLKNIVFILSLKKRQTKINERELIELISEDIIYTDSWTLQIKRLHHLILGSTNESNKWED